MRIVATVVLIIVWLLCVASFALGFTAGRQPAQGSASKHEQIRCNFLKLT